MRCIDLNCDLGEGMLDDAAIMPYISSANIACGFHAGDEMTIRKTVQLAIENGVAIGAHPGYPDKANFGRMVIEMSAGEIYSTVEQQVSILNEICGEEGATLHHVKPHGALYNEAARNAEIAHAIALAVRGINDQLIMYGLSGSILIKEAGNIGLKTASEVFADRTYQDDGSLTPRSQMHALIEDESTSLKQVLQMVLHQTVTTVNNKEIEINADTICIHGDGKHAVKFAKGILNSLIENHITIKTL